MMLRLAFLLLWLLFSADIAHAQARVEEAIPVTPDLLAPGTARITPQTEQFLLYTISEDHHQIISLLNRFVEIDSRDGQQILRVVQRYEGADGVNTDSIWVEHATLAPLAYSSYSLDQTQQFTFSPGKVSGLTSSTEHGDQPVELTIEDPCYNAVVLEEIIKALPLKIGSTFSFQSYNPGRALMTNRIRVDGVEPVPLVTGHSINVWVLVLEGGALPTTLWVAQDTQALIRLRTSLPNGDEFWKVRLYREAKPDH